MFEGFRKSEPEYIEKREDKEGLAWKGFDNSFEILPHLNLNWKEIEAVHGETGKPVGDLGPSFSTLPTECLLRDIEVVPIDIMHESNKGVYATLVYKRFNDWRLRAVYCDDYSLPFDIKRDMGFKKPFDNDDRPYTSKFFRAVDEATREVSKRFIVADLARIPLADKALSIAIAHDSVPKHSLHLDKFLREQLPEILRVTDTAAYIYPLAIFKTVKKEARATNDEFYETGREMIMKDFLEETHALYEDPEALEQIKKVAEELGFEFTLECGRETESSVYTQAYRKLSPVRQQKAMLGVFKRKVE